ncbi:Hpt domain-containing protein [Pirellula sp. SH-Sr6A]|uniref:Hpt domain-containing protein n=1 Tax=Pirellula sp. SH-Sr6A TaxID=1632865 RepID=UPI0014392ADC|nr:Hpt domain-containing protein [Pirellula sp. SH-Sr6A]
MNKKLHSPLAFDPDFTPVLIEFVSNLRLRDAAIREALRSKDLPSLRRIAHQLKGAFGAYGFPALTNLAADVERLIDSGEGLRDIAIASDRLLDAMSLVSAEPETL